MKHSFSTSITKRDHNNRGIEWTAKCGRHATWTGATYEQVEDSWRRHHYETTGALPEPMVREGRSPDACRGVGMIATPTLTVVIVPGGVVVTGRTAPKPVSA